MVTFVLIGQPLILRLGGASEIAPIVYRVPADFYYRKKKDRRELYAPALNLGQMASGAPRNMARVVPAFYRLLSAPTDWSHSPKR